MAEASPTGTDTASEITTTIVLPTTIGSTPKLGVAKVGAHCVPVRNSTIETSRKKLNVGGTSEKTIAPVTSTDRAAVRNRPPSISFSPYRGRDTASDRRVAAPALEARSISADISCP
jgi:hypothetical protein